MITILIDHNIEGQAAMLRGALMEAGWLELFPLQMKTFADPSNPFYLYLLPAADRLSANVFSVS